MMLAVIPIAEPDRVELRAKFSADVTPQRLQRMLEKSVSIPLRSPPHVALEELEGDEVTVMITAAPLNPSDGPKLANDVLAAVRDSDLDGRPTPTRSSPTPTTRRHPSPARHRRRSHPRTRSTRTARAARAG